MTKTTARSNPSRSSEVKESTIATTSVGCYGPGWVTESKFTGCDEYLVATTMDSTPGASRGFDTPRASSSSTALSSSGQNSPVGEGLSRRTSWARPRDLDLQPDLAAFKATLPDNPPQNPFVDDEPRPFHYNLPSQSSLDSPTHTPYEREDEARLTGSTYPPWREDAFRSEQDLHIAGPSRSPRRTPKKYGGENRASAAGSAALKVMSRNLRRMSLRVVNLAGSGLDDRPVRLPEDLNEAEEEPEPEPVHVEERRAQPARTRLRGRTLIIFGPTNPIRIAMYNILLSRCVPMVHFVSFNTEPFASD
jgi:voltage-dependent calcium channel